MRFVINVFTLVLICTISANADGFKKYAGEFMNLGAGGRLGGMAGAGTAFANDVTAGYWNPAGLTDADGFQAEFMHSKQFISSIQNNFFAISNQNADSSVLAFSVQYLTVNGIKDSRDAYDYADDKVDYSLIKYFNTADYSFLLSYAKSYDDKLSYGMNVKLIYRDYHSEMAYGIGFDAGLKYRFNRNLRFGVMFRDITSTMIAWSSGEKEFVVPSLRLGTAYLYELSFWDLSVQPSCDFNILFENRRSDSQFNLGSMSLDSFWGFEAGYKDIFSLRAGMDDLQRFSTGVGLKIPKLTFHYAFTPDNNELGNIQRISVHLQLDSVFNF